MNMIVVITTDSLSDSLRKKPQKTPQKVEIYLESFLCVLLLFFIYLPLLSSPHFNSVGRCRKQ